MEAISKPDMDGFIELAYAGAVQAGDAFGQLVGQSVTTTEPAMTHDENEERSGDARVSSVRDSASTGVFFEFEGCLDAVIGILFPGDASELLVRRIVGLKTSELEAPIVESALMEVGNILASHVASAIADRLGARLLPSIPALAMSNADTEMEIFLEQTVGREAPRIESRLLDEAGGLIGRLVLVPTR
jgi:chemotaxis protein CheY-P-specific phosphatase CheC